MILTCDPAARERQLAADAREVADTPEEEAYGTARLERARGRILADLDALGGCDGLFGDRAALEARLAEVDRRIQRRVEHLGDIEAARREAEAERYDAWLRKKYPAVTDDTRLVYCGACRSPRRPLLAACHEPGKGLPPGPAGYATRAVGRGVVHRVAVCTACAGEGSS